MTGWNAGASTGTDRTAPADNAGDHRRVEAESGEPRWPVALALGSFIAITIVLWVTQPERESLGPPWLVPGIEVALLLALLAASPADLRRAVNVFA